MKLMCYWMILFTLIVSGCQYNGEDKQILDIRNHYQRWQQAVGSSTVSSQKLYHVYQGEYFDEDEWLDSSQPIGEGFVGEEVTFYTDEKLGNLLKIIETSPSGDWSIRSKHYYGPRQKLFYIFWSMNTSQADEPVTVERRLFFNSEGDVIRRLETVYKMNTIVQIEEPNYFDQDVTYWPSMDSVPFRNLLKIK